jgi:hypothetical protein
MELELYGGPFLKISKMAFKSFKKNGSINLDVGNYGIY